MAKVKFGPKGMTWSGKVGHGIYRTLNGETILQQAPVRKDDLERSPAQLAQQDRTYEAGHYGKFANETPELRPVYEAIAAWEQNQVVSMANRDAFKSPVVEHIDASRYRGRPGDVIAVHATDDTGVVELDVVIADVDADIIEAGAAEQGDDGWWIYKAQAAVAAGTSVRIGARAVDRPRNEAFSDIRLEVRKKAKRGRPRKRPYIPHGGGHPTLWWDAARPEGARREVGGAAAPDGAPGGGVAMLADMLRSGSGTLAHSQTRAENVIADLLTLAGGKSLDAPSMVKEARTRAGLTQRDLARRAGTTASAISRLECGGSSPSVEYLQHLLDAAGYGVVAVLVERGEG